MAGFLAYIIPVEGGAGPPGGGDPPRPSHPIMLPGMPGWGPPPGGGGQPPYPGQGLPPFPSPPIYWPPGVPPTGGGPRPPSGPVDPGYSPPWAQVPGGGGGGGPVDPGYSPPWAQVPGGGGGGGAPVYPSHPIYWPPYPDQGLPPFPSHPIAPGGPGSGPPGIWGPTDPRPTHPIAGVPGAPGYTPPPVNPPVGGSRPEYPTNLPSPGAIGILPMCRDRAGRGRITRRAANPRQSRHRWTPMRPLFDNTLPTPEPPPA